MSQVFAEALSWVPKSRGLAVTLARAFDYAKDQSHRTVMLEHLLLALAADADASAVLQACNVDLARLNGDVTSYLAGVDEMLPPGQSADPAASSDLLRILEYASAAAQQSRRREINGAIVLAAIVGDGRSPAASMLRAQGLTFEETIKALQWANAAARSAGQPAAQPASGPSADATAPQPLQTSPAGPGDGPPRSGPPPSAPPPAAPLPRDNRERAEPRPAPPQSANGATTQSTEELLAAARRRISSAHTGGQPTPAPSNAAPDPAHASAPRAHHASHGSEPVHRPYHEPGRPVPPQQPELVEEDTADPVSGHGHGGRSSVSPPVPPMPPTPPTPGPARLHPQPTNLQHHGWGGRPDGHGAASALQADADPGPPLDWPRQPADGDQQPPRQYHRNPDPGMGHPFPPRSRPLPQQKSQYAHSTSPAGRHHAEQPQLRPIEVPWSEPPPPQPYPMGRDQAARPPAPLRHAAAGVHRTTAGGSERAALPLSAGHLIESIPRTMTAELPVIVEVHIAKADIAALSGGLQGAGAAYRHDVIVTKAMSVKLRAPEGGFWVEAVSPETQWIGNELSLLSDDHASWRWIVTPQWRGRSRLQLVVSARTVGADGLVAETGLPDQVIEVKVRANYRQAAVHWGSLLGAAAVGGILATFGKGIWELGRAVLIQFGVV